jgi:hypothetical protein
LDNILNGVDTQDKEEEVLDLILQECRRYGNVIVRRAYGDAMRFARLRRTMMLNAIEVLDLPTPGMQQKNFADIKLVVDALEMALGNNCAVQTFVIASGDSDFTPLLAKLRSYGKGTVMMSNSRAMSSLLPAYCDHTVEVEELIARAPNTPSDRELLLRAMHVAAPGDEVVRFRVLETTVRNLMQMEFGRDMERVIRAAETEGLVEIVHGRNLYTKMGLRLKHPQSLLNVDFSEDDMVSALSALPRSAVVLWRCECVSSHRQRHSLSSGLQLTTWLWTTTPRSR